MFPVSSEAVQKLKSVINLAELVNEYTPLKKVAPGRWLGKCPNPDHRDSEPSFNVYKTEKGWSWCCYGCHSGKVVDNNGKIKADVDSIAFYQWITSIELKREFTFQEAIKDLGEIYGIEVDTKKNLEFVSKYKINKARMIAYQKNLTKEAIEYLYSRGLDDNDIAEWNIGFIETKEHNQLVPRIVFPILNRDKKVIGSSRRKMPNAPESAVKYWNTPNSDLFQKRKVLYGIDKIDYSYDYVYITEGVMDVILATKYGIKNVLAPMGTSFTDEQMEIVKALNKKVVLCMDGDSAGQKAIFRNATLLANIGVYANVLIVPDEKDLAELSIEKRDALLAFVKSNTLPYWQYKLLEPAREFESELSILRSRMLPKIKESLNGVQSDEDNILMKSFVQEKFGLAL